MPKTKAKRKRKAKHRVRMVIEFDFGYHDEVGMDSNIPDRLPTKAETIKGIKEEVKYEGIVEYMRGCAYNPQAKVKSIKFLKFDK